MHLAMWSPGPGEEEEEGQNEEEKNLSSKSSSSWRSGSKGQERAARGREGRSREV